MSRPRVTSKAVFALVLFGVAMCLLGGLDSARAQGTTSRRVREYRRPWRSGVVSFGLQGQLGYNSGGTAFTDPFDWGPGLAINARYVATRMTTIGVRFEVHNYDATESPITSQEIFGSDQPIPIDSQRVTMAGVDLYLYRDRTKETMYYTNFGAGIYQISILLSKSGYLETQSSKTEPDRIYLMGGLGLEHFLRRTVSFDLNGKLFAYLGDSTGTPVAVQLAAGLEFYFFD
jgi:hypothetical protein